MNNKKMIAGQSQNMQIQEDELLDILKHMQVPCRSNFNGIFTDKARLQAIHEELSESPFFDTFSGMNCEIYTKRGKKSFAGEDVLLISTHVDTVDSIHKLFAIQDDEKRLLAGTFDNTLTNAACVYLMEYCDLPDSVVFAFTADEETGRCRGAERTYRYLTEHGADPRRLSILSLDATYEGYGKCAFTLENLACVKHTSPLVEFANGMELPYLFAVPLAYWACVPENLPEDCLSPNSSWFDEGAFYRRYEQQGLREAVSLCMPVCTTRRGHNDMHTDVGVYAQTDDYMNYVKVLEAYARDYLNERERLAALLEALYPQPVFAVSRNLLQELEDLD